MFHVEYDAERNLLRVNYSDRVRADEVALCAARVSALASALRASFRLLVDLSGLERMDVEALPHLGRIMDVCNERGVAKVARIIPDPSKDPGLNILSFFHYAPRVEVASFVSETQALQMLLS